MLGLILFIFKPICPRHPGFGIHQTAEYFSATGITPPAGSLSAALIACDASNARTVTGREFHYMCLMNGFSIYIIVLRLQINYKLWGQKSLWTNSASTFTICE